MEWHVTDARSLAIIDREIGEHNLSPAEYEIVRQTIYATADFEYKDLLRFSNRALEVGSAALAARTTIVVDVPIVQTGIATKVWSTFANPVYCATEAITRPQKDKSQAAWGIETLAQRYPEAIFAIGSSQTALTALTHLIDSGEIKPVLVIGVPSGFVNIDAAKDRLLNSSIPNICVAGRKGNAVVAVAILNALLELSWQAYGSREEF